ncbi:MULTISPECIES: hypothetical protein [unclassified Lacinutrix]
MKGKITGILLLFCLITPVVSTFTFLHFQKRRVRREVKGKMITGINKNELVLLKFTEAETQTEIRWEHSKEFEFKGQMYDIVEKHVEGDNTYYWCWWDHEETKLNKQLDRLLTNVLGNIQKRQEKKNQLTDFFKKLFHENQENHLAITSKQEKKHFSYTEGFSTFYHAPPIPPPRFS